MKTKYLIKNIKIKHEVHLQYNKENHSKGMNHKKNVKSQYINVK